MMGYYGTGWGQGWMVTAMWIWPILVGLAIWALVALTRGGRAAPSPTPSDDPREILKRRFASGQISEDEYLTAEAILKNEGSRAARA